MTDKEFERRLINVEKAIVALCAIAAKQEPLFDTLGEDFFAVTNEYNGHLSPPFIPKEENIQ